MINVSGILKYYYNIDVDLVRNDGNYYYFKYGDNFYILSLVKDKNRVFNFQKNMNIFNRNAFFHRAVNNKYSKSITVVNNDAYILLSINLIYNRLINFNDLLNNQLLYVSSEDSYAYRLDWIDLWKNKIDYFERYFMEKGIAELDVNVLANYYIGLGESAIAYLSDTLLQYGFFFNDFVVAHYRIGNNDTLVEWYNPLNVLVDHKARDLAEYLKSLFFVGKYDFYEISKCLLQSGFSEIDFRILYARLLFPSYFFDKYERFINEKIGEKELFCLANTIDEYGKYLKKIYVIISKISHIPVVEWIN